jgi:hypothetical protein
MPMSIETLQATEADLPLLYAVVREEFPHLSAESWQSFGAAYLDETAHGGLRGIVAARATSLQKYRGLFLYSVETTLRHPRTLVVPYVIMPQTFGSELIVGRFAAALLALAERNACGLMEARVSPAVAESLLPKLGARAESDGVSSFIACIPAASALPGGVASRRSVP